MADTNSASNFNFKDIISKDKMPRIFLICFIVFVAIAITVSIVALGINPVIACVMAILEAGLVACLHRIPIWVHGLVFIAQVVCGVIASQVVFMVLMAFVYVCAITFLFVWANKS